MATIRLTRDVLQEVFVTYPAGTVITDADNGWADAMIRSNLAESCGPAEPGGRISKKEFLRSHRKFDPERDGLLQPLPL